MIIVYVLIIMLANIITSMFPPLFLFNGYLIVPLGTFLVGVTFLLRDIIQLRIGRTNVYRLVWIATVASLFVNIVLNNTLYVTLASAVSFLLSETIDTEIFTRFKGSVNHRIAVSGFFGGTVDSIVFILIGLSPLGSGVLEWNVIPFAVLGQSVIKFLLQLIVLPILKDW